MYKILKEKYENKCLPLRKILENNPQKGPLTVPLGEDEDKEPHYIDFSNVPCLLVTGETGSGKSVYLDCVIVSLLLQNKKEDLKFIMIDPKKIELSYYQQTSYLLGSLVSDKEESYYTLEKINNEYINRIKKLHDKNPKFSQLFIIIDESNDIMAMDNSLFLLKNMIRDCDKVGMHFIIATNNHLEDSFDKEFINTVKYKMTFDLIGTQVASWIGIRDSQNLSAPGEAIATGNNKRFKLQTPYIDDEDIKKVIKHIK